MKVSGDGFEEFSQSPGHHGHHQPTGRRALMLLRCRGRPGRGITMDHGVEKKLASNTAMRRWGWVKTLVPLVNIKIAGKCMFIPLKMVSIGIDPYPDLLRCAKMQTGWWFTYPSEKYESQLG